MERRRSRAEAVLGTLGAAAALLLTPGSLATAQDSTQTQRDSVARANAAAPADTMAMRTTMPMRRDTARMSGVTPPVDPARAIDAQVRVALFEMLTDRHLPAMGRLQFLNSAPTTLSGPGAATGLRGREDVLFLLAQGYHRLGMSDLFRTNAQGVLSLNSSSRYAGLLRTQLAVEAYRAGDFPRAAEMSRAIDEAGNPGLGGLVGGLALYQTGDFAGARTQFARSSSAAGSGYSSFAQYMDALATLRSDTAQKAQALQALQALAGSAQGEVADQARLTAAQIAYEANQFEQAATLAAAVPANSGFAAQALLTRAWAQYKGNQLAPAGEAFAQFATRYPQLPERDEALLMAAQVRLQLGQTDEAGRMFRAVADVATAEAQQLQGDARAAMTEAARALVTARAAELLFLTDPSSGKTIALSDNEAGTRAAVLAASSGMAVEGMSPAAPMSGGMMAGPEILSVDDITARLNAAGPALAGPLARRAIFTPVSTTAKRADYARSSEALYDADLAVSIARYRLEAAMAAQAEQLALVRRMQAMLNEEAGMLASMTARLQLTQDSLARLLVGLDAAGARIRQLLEAQINDTRLVVTENLRMLDSVRQNLGGGLTDFERSLLTIEEETARTYGRIVERLAAGLPQALTNHPVFARRDTVRMKGDSVRSLLTQVQGALAQSQQALNAELARLESGDQGMLAPFRSALQAAEARRATAETGLVSVVERELAARAGEMLADLRRDTEAAEFGSASAAFFAALDAGRPAGAAPGASGAGNSGTSGVTGGSTSGTQPTNSGASTSPPPAPPAAAPSATTTPRK